MPSLLSGHGLWIVSSFLVTIIQAGGPDKLEEYCQLDTFRASCPPGHVIMMAEANYGRMRLGKCLDREYFVGCTADVLSIMDVKCSGRRKCEVTIPDQALVGAQPCPRDIVGYLEARYSCIQVISATSTDCSHGEVELNESSGFLAVADVDPGRSTPADCRFHLRAKEGQHISVTLYDFLSGPSSGIYPAGQHQCTLYGTVFEEDKKTIICSAFQRQTTIYSSSTNHIVVQLDDVNFRASNQSYFLLKFQAEGCANPPQPEDAHMVRRGDQLDVICNKTVRSWHLVCRDTSWVGEIDNCSAEQSAEWNTPSDGDEKSGGGLRFPHGMVVAVIIGVALGVLIGFLLLFFIYAARRRAQKQKQQRWPREGKALLYETSQQEYASKRGGGDSRAPPAPYRADLGQRFLQQQHPDCDDTTLAIPMGHLTRSQGAHGVHVYESTATPAALDDRTILRGSYSCDCDSRCDSGVGLNAPSNSGPP